MTRTAALALGGLYGAISQASWQSPGEARNSRIKIYEAVSKLIDSGVSNRVILDLVQVISLEFSE
jgi:hypothetical protein